MARELLARDAKNLAAYFRKQGVKVTAEETLKRITPPEKVREPIGRDEPAEEENEQQEE
jgi:serine/threonine-protein kinase RIO1